MPVSLLIVLCITTRKSDRSIYLSAIHDSYAADTKLQCSRRAAIVAGVCILEGLLELPELCPDSWLVLDASAHIQVQCLNLQE